MLLCCLAMAAGFAIVAYESWAERSLGTAALAALPLLACLGMHAFVHRIAARAHTHSKTNKDNHQ